MKSAPPYLERGVLWGSGVILLVKIAPIQVAPVAGSSSQLLLLLRALLPLV